MGLSAFQIWQTEHAHRPLETLAQVIVFFLYKKTHRYYLHINFMCPQLYTEVTEKMHLLIRHICKEHRGVGNYVFGSRIWGQVKTIDLNVSQWGRALIWILKNLTIYQILHKTYSYGNLEMAGIQ